MADWLPSFGSSPRQARWYVVHVKANEEECAARHLEQQGFTIFCPRMARTIRHARKVRTVFVPLFPGYLFVELDVSRQVWHCINGSRGVVRLVTQGERPSAVPHGVVEALQQHAGLAMEDTSKLKLGMPVRIESGIFTDLIGKLHGMDRSGRVRVLLDLLGRSVVVALESDAVAPTA